jgi:hypothetical protein
MKESSGGAGASSGGDESKYMKEYSGGAGVSSSGNYDKYMKQYASHASKYQESAGANAARASFEKKAASKKMSGKPDKPTEKDEFMKKFGQEYKDDSELMKKFGQETTDSIELVQQKSADSADGADYKEYTQGFVPKAKSTSDQKEGRDYMKKFGQEYQDKFVPHIKNRSDAHEWRDAYKKEYAGKYLKEYDGAEHLPKDATQKQQANYYTKKYAGAYDKYIKENEASNKADEKMDKQKKEKLPEGPAAVTKNEPQASKKESQAPAKKSSWPLVETDAAVTPDTETSVVAQTQRDSLLPWIPFSFAAFAAAAILFSLGVFVFRRMQNTTEIEFHGFDMYSAYAPLV